MNVTQKFGKRKGRGQQDSTAELEVATCKQLPAPWGNGSLKAGDDWIASVLACATLQQSLAFCCTPSLPRAGAAYRTDKDFIARLMGNNLIESSLNISVASPDFLPESSLVLFLSASLEVLFSVFFSQLRLQRHPRPSQGLSPFLLSSRTCWNWHLCILCSA